MNKTTFGWVLIQTAAVLLLASPLGAIGPRSATSSGNAVKWASMPVTVHLESDLMVGTKDVTPLVADALTTWQDLPESNVVITQGTLGVAVDDTNICDSFFDPAACPSGPLADGLNPLVIDEDGSIVADFFGGAARFTTLGFASILQNYNPTSGAAVKGEAVFNAACLAGVEMAGCARGAGPGDDLSFSDDDFTSFIVHEMGHFLGLDHQQANLAEAADSDTSNDYLITTMFPTFLVGNGVNFKVPHTDDRAALAQLYPAASFTSSTWTIEGKVLWPDKTEIQCANLVARNVADPRVDAISALSGDFFPAGTADGSFEIVGLTAGATYTIDLEPLGSGLIGPSGFTPCRGSGGEAAPPSFTAATSSTTFTGSAGETVEATCTTGSGCVAGSGGGGSSSGGCSLVPY